MTPATKLIARSITALALASALILPTTGCQSAKQKAASETASTVAAFRKNLDAMPNNIDQVIGALTAMRAENNTNRAQTFRDLSTQFAWMQNRAKELGVQADKATADSSAYFRAWAEEAMADKSPAERKRVADNISSRRDLRDTALSYLTDGRQRYQDLAYSVRDVQNSLRTNLTQANITALTPEIERIVLEATDVKNYIDRFDDQIDTILATK